MTSGATTIAERYAALVHEIDEELRACGRVPGSVTIVGVAKRQPAAAVIEALRAGLADVAENYVQEAKRKFPSILSGAEGTDVRTHFVGHLQTNKAKAVAGLFDVVQSIDRPEAVVALARAVGDTPSPISVLVQVNVSPTERFGCEPAQASRLAELVRERPQLRLEGVMAIGPLDATPQETQRAFELAAKTFDRIGGSTLSIGMSGDWRLAVRAGSTMVRIGSALFGARQT